MCGGLVGGGVKHSLSAELSESEDAANSPCSTELGGDTMPAVGVAVGMVEGGYWTSLLRYRMVELPWPELESWEGTDREERKPFTTF